MRNHEENQLRSPVTVLESQPRPAAQPKPAKPCSVAIPDGHYLDDHCGGDLGWEQRMREHYPTWQPTDTALWDVFHE